MLRREYGIATPSSLTPVTHREDAQPNEAINKRSQKLPPTVRNTVPRPYQSGNGYRGVHIRGGSSNSSMSQRGQWTQHAVWGNSSWRGRGRGQHQQATRGGYWGSGPRLPAQGGRDEVLSKSLSSSSGSSGSGSHRQESPRPLEKEAELRSYSSNTNSHQRPELERTSYPTHTSSHPTSGNRNWMFRSRSPTPKLPLLPPLKRRKVDESPSSHYPKEEHMSMDIDLEPRIYSMQPSTMSASRFPLPGRGFKTPVKQEPTSPTKVQPTPTPAYEPSAAVKREPRSPSPLPTGLINATRHLVKQWSTFYPFPDSCKKSNPDYRKNRQAFFIAKNKVLLAHGLKKTRVLTRDDGLSIDWTSPVDVWSDTFERPDLASIIQSAHESNHSLASSSSASAPAFVPDIASIIQSAHESNHNLATSSSASAFASVTSKRATPSSSQPHSRPPPVLVASSTQPNTARKTVIIDIDDPLPSSSSGGGRRSTTKELTPQARRRSGSGFFSDANSNSNSNAQDTMQMQISPPLTPDYPPRLTQRAPLPGRQNLSSQSPSRSQVQGQPPPPPPKRDAVVVSAAAAFSPPIRQSATPTPAPASSSSSGSSSNHQQHYQQHRQPASSASSSATGTPTQPHVNPDKSPVPLPVAFSPRIRPHSTTPVSAYKPASVLSGSASGPPPSTPPVPPALSVQPVPAPKPAPDPDLTMAGHLRMKFKPINPNAKRRESVEVHEASGALSVVGGAPMPRSSSLGKELDTDASGSWVGVAVPPLASTVAAPVQQHASSSSSSLVGDLTAAHMQPIAPADVIVSPAGASAIIATHDPPNTLMDGVEEAEDAASACQVNPDVAMDQSVDDIDQPVADDESMTSASADGFGGEMESLVGEFLQQFCRLFDSDRSKLEMAYAKNALFSCRVHHHEEPSFSMAGLFVPEVRPCFRSSHSRASASAVDQGRTHISNRLLSMGPYQFCPRGVSRTLHYDIVHAGMDAEGILVTVHGEVVNPNFVAGPHLDHVLTLDQSFLLRPRGSGGGRINGRGEWEGGADDDDDDDGENGLGQQVEVDWPLVIISHQMTVRAVPLLTTETLRECLPWIDNIL